MTYFCILPQKMFHLLKSAADVIAPPPTFVQELEYHWKQLKTFYNNQENLSNVPRHINSTNIPHHLESILQCLLQENLKLNETTSNEPNKDNVDSKKECMDFILTNRPLDLLFQLAVSDNPPGIKICILNWLRRFLSCIDEPPLQHSSLYQPIRNFIRICNGKIPSPYEEEEILFLETISGLIRKNSYLMDIFLPSHEYSAAVSLTKGNRIRKLPTKNPLFQCSKLETNIRRVEIIPDSNSETNNSIVKNDESCDMKNESVYDDSMECDCEDNDRFYLLDGILTYLESPDSKIVVRACESAMILCSLPNLNQNCISVAASLNDFTMYLIEKVIMLYERIPDDMDIDVLEDCSISWGLIPREPEERHFVGKSQVYEFLCWLDYVDCLIQESTKMNDLLIRFRNEFLLSCVESTLLATDTPFVLVLLSKIIKQIHSDQLMDEIANWLVGETTSELYSATDCLLTIILENISSNNEILIAGLQFIEALLDNANEKILHEMIFRYLNKRGYYDNSQPGLQTWSDEEDERERRRGSTDVQIKSKTLSPHNILKVINHFLLLIPRQIVNESTGTCYEEYVQDANRHYKIWVAKTRNFDWPKEAVTLDRNSSSTSPVDLAHCNPSSSRHNSAEQCNDSGICEERFCEGPLLKLLFSHVKNMSAQNCEINLAIIAILSKLAFLPHPYLHEILLNPEIPIVSEATTLWSSMQICARKLLLEIPKHENFQQRIGETSKRLLSNPPIICCDEEFDDIEQFFEAIVILEEFCKELAAIAFVKYHHATE